jgi:hypothetical protein
MVNSVGCSETKHSDFAMALAYFRGNFTSFLKSIKFKFTNNLVTDKNSTCILQIYTLPIPSVENFEPTQIFMYTGYIHVTCISNFLGDEFPNN